MSIRARYVGLSDPLRTERRIELIVLALLALLLLQFGWGSYRAMFPPIPDPVRPMRDSLQVADVLGLSVASPQQRAQIRQRPLFWASRAPLIPVAVTPKPEPAKTNEIKPGKIENVKLSGVFGSGDTGGVIVISKGKKRRLMVGEELNGWKLQSLEPFSALFSSGAQQATLALSITEISQVQGVEESALTDEQAAPNQTKPDAEKEPQRAVKKNAEKRDSLRLGGGARR
ncbi:MAG: hypothetical protein ABJN62_08890 [Halioglobus sp.]